jgi:hypothetical protein
MPDQGSISLRPNFDGGVGSTWGEVSGKTIEGGLGISNGGRSEVGWGSKREEGFTRYYLQWKDLGPNLLQAKH